MIKQSLAGAVLALTLTGCAQTVALSTSTNDFVNFATKTNTTEQVALAFTSTYAPNGGEKVIPFRQGYDAGVRPGHTGYSFDEVSTLRRMVTEYVGNKFANVNAQGQTQVSVELQDFAIEEFSPDSQGMQILTALAGNPNDIRVNTGARLKMLVTINRPGREASAKVITATVQEDGSERKTLATAHAATINAVNNKALMMLNQFLEAEGL
jgi:hypothetical protein